MTIRIPLAPGKSSEKKRRRGVCVTPRCTNVAPPGKGCCRTCQDRKWRAKYPERHLFKNLKASAKKRGVEFTLRYEEFALFCAQNDYVARVGHGPENLTVDRIDPSRGYSADNIRALTNAENARLGGYLANSGHRTRGQGSLPLEEAAASSSRHYSPEENPLSV